MDTRALDTYVSSVKFLLAHITQLVNAVRGPHWALACLHGAYLPIDAHGKPIQPEGEGADGYHFVPFQISVPPELVDMCEASMRPVKVFDTDCWTAGEAAQPQGIRRGGTSADHRRLSAFAGECLRPLWRCAQDAGHRQSPRGGEPC